MFTSVKPFREILKLPVCTLVAIWIVIGGIVFVPDTIIENPQFIRFKDNYGHHLLAFFTIAAIGIMAYLFTQIVIFWHRRQARQQMIKRCVRFTEKEKQILRYYIGHETQTNVLYSQDITVKQLVREGILKATMDRGQTPNCYIFILNQAFFNYLYDNPDWLYGTTEIYIMEK